MQTAISLGWNCASAMSGVSNFLRKRKIDGYKTCPFDIMVSNVNGIIECINDDFKYFCDPNYLKVVTIKDKFDHLNCPVGTTILVHTKYKFIFNHESSGHVNLWQDEKWEKGQFHFEMDNFYEFIKRYEKRIENFRYYLNNGYEITFIITKVNNTPEGNVELDECIKRNYPNLKYNYLLTEDVNFVGDFLDYMKFVDNICQE